MKKSAVCILGMVLIGFCNVAHGQYFNSDYDVPYVPTKYPVVERMLEMANVTGNDILYDLGCGDGRIVVTAAKKFGTHGTGVDINPVRITESRENAMKEGVTDRVRFIEGNLFEADIHDATVVTLYLLPSVNLKLRPKLFKELRPGTRIVSHDFDMGEWEPDQSTVMEDVSDIDEDSFFNHTIYFWVIPANVSGKWDVMVSDDGGQKRYVLELGQAFQRVYGTIVDGNFSIPLKNVSITGNKLQFSFEARVRGRQSDIVYSGTAAGDVLTGTVTAASGVQSWKAKRDPSTIVPLDAPSSK